MDETIGTNIEARLYCDGKAEPNPGPGNWAFILIEPDGKEHRRNGRSDMASNSEMELVAACEALEYTIAQGFNEIIAFTDSDYVRKGIREWIPLWTNPKKGQKPWTTTRGEPVKNQKLWIRLYSLNARASVQWNWVESYGDHHLHELADNLVQHARDQVQKVLVDHRPDIIENIWEDVEGFEAMVREATQTAESLYLSSIKMYKTHATCIFVSGFLIDPDTVVELIGKSFSQRWKVELEYVERRTEDADLYFGVLIQLNLTG